MSSDKRGLVLFYTGDGDGMTAAALGQAFRSVGRGFAVCFIRFVWGSQEREAFVPPELPADRVEFHTLGEAHASKTEDPDADRQFSHAAWDLACAKIASGKFDLVVLDHVMDMVARGMLSEQEVVQALAGRPDKVNLIVTGPYAPESVIAAADLVTEVRERRNR